MARECILSTGKLPPGGFPRNSVVRITDDLAHLMKEYKYKLVRVCVFWLLNIGCNGPHVTWANEHHKSAIKWPQNKMAYVNA